MTKAMTADRFYNIVSPHSITGYNRIMALYDSLEHIRLHDIPGALVECGVMAGGNILGMMEYCDYHKMYREIWAYDTFTGMTAPEDMDKDYRGCHASEQDVSCCVPLAKVIRNLSGSDYDTDYIHFVVGDICETLKDELNIPPQIALLRLDTDFYASTKAELRILYPLLVTGGVLIVDDYGHWQGARQAVDEYFGDTELFEKIDYTGIKLIK